ncbi:alpha/beta hydrolase [Belliella sp. DSM 111904]|uniref:Alpha/beta hydrolase n=1 Tax=Belliella filtrata TaxID=2923435 RepID=A0ABS9UYY8_9BACT|nr:alpha/beta hydrolase [Belliella filtrata]MCH7409385.1 alpha/beta hydrolase [Belliella filtrata]
MKKVGLYIVNGLLGFLLLILIILISSYRSDLTLDELAPRYMDQFSHMITVDQVPVHVSIKGKGEAIILIHGSFSSLHCWKEWEKELSQHFLTISIDLPGHGLTGPDPEKRYSIGDYARLVASIAQQLEIKEYHLVGNSMGGAVAMMIASTFPDQVLTLNLVNAAGAFNLQSENDNVEIVEKESSSRPTIFKIANSPLASKILLKCTPRWLFKLNLQQVYHDNSKIDDEQVTRYYELMRREGNRQATLDRLAIQTSYVIEAEKLQMPIMIMWGKQDTWIPVSNVDQFKRMLPEAYVKIYNHTGHVPMEERPTETVAEYLSFLGIQADRDYFSAPNYYSYAYR